MTDNPSPPDPRVLHVDDARSWRGGQQQVLLLMRELKEKGVAQWLATPPDSALGLRAAAEGLAVVPLTMWGEWDPFAAGHLAALARRHNANLIHAHTAHAHAIGLATVRRLRGKRGLARLGLGSRACPRFPVEEATCARQVRLVTTRRVDFPIGEGLFGAFSRRKYLDPHQHFIAISQAVAAVLTEAGIPPDRLDVVHSGVAPIPPEEAWPRERVRETFGIAPDEIAIVTVGALTDHKGHRWLVQAAPQIVQEVPKARIHVLGEGELRCELESQITRLNLRDKLILHGHVESARLKLAGFDLYVSSSHLEGLGTAILDAMLAGLPVVAARAGGIPEAVIDGSTGRLVPPRDPDALAQAVINTLRNPETARSMTQSARQHVQENFSARAMAEGTVGFYRKILSSPG